MTDEKQLLHGHWVVAFIDLLGQKEAFLKTDFMPDAGDPESVQALISAVKDSLGVVRLLRTLLESFRKGADNGVLAEDSPLREMNPDQIASAQRMKRRRVRELRWSDGVVLYAPLWTSADHSPVMGLCDILASASVLMLVQLAAGKPVRGGIDVGTGIEDDGQLFGAALVKAYLLESEVAQHPRVAIGESLIEYLNGLGGRSGPSPEEQFTSVIATRLRALIATDEDDVSFLDYAGQQAQSIFSSAAPLGMFVAARKFAYAARARWRDEGNVKLFERYSKVVRYLDSRVDAHSAT